MKNTTQPYGVGLGFRLQLADDLLTAQNSNARFLEIAPENYLEVGGRRKRLLESAGERWPVVCHGLSGDFAGAQEFDEEYYRPLKRLLGDLGVQWYSDHLCYTHLPGGAIHDLVPLPFNEVAVQRAAERIRRIQDYLDLPIAIENVSAYATMPGGEMREEEFVRAVLEAADCRLLLDVNNVYVNAQNFGFDAREYIDSLPLERTIQIHVAGHEHDERENLLIDSHGAPIIDPVYELLDYTLERLPHDVPILLERDNQIPPLAELEAELTRLNDIVAKQEVKHEEERSVRNLDAATAV